MSGIRTHLRAGVRPAAGVGLAVAAVALTSVFATAATASPAEPLADVLVSATPAQNPVGPGAKFDLDIVAGNLGATAEGIRITSELPAGVTFPDKSQAIWDCEASTATKIDCSTAAPLEPHGFAELRASLAVAHNYPGPRLTIPVKVSTPTRESNTQNNSARAVVQVSKRVVADVYATASANPQQVVRGGTFALTFGGGNKGNTSAADIRFTAALPAGLELVNAPGGIYNCSASTATTLDCTTAGDLIPGAYEFATATVRVTDRYSYRAARVPVTVSTSNRETERRNNTAVANVRVTQP
jgi:uncharacterized repeat protein (TIGR01451 family)